MAKLYVELFGNCTRENEIAVCENCARRAQFSQTVISFSHLNLRTKIKTKIKKRSMGQQLRSIIQPKIFCIILLLYGFMLHI